LRRKKILADQLGYIKWNKNRVNKINPFWHKFNTPGLPLQNPAYFKGRHAGLPLQNPAYLGAVGANLRVRPGLSQWQ